MKIDLMKEKIPSNLNNKEFELKTADDVGAEDSIPRCSSPKTSKFL